MTLCTNCKHNDDCIITNMDAIQGSCKYYTPKTNADQFRANSDEELAHLLVYSPWMSEESVLDWLKQEVDSDTT